MRPNGVHWFRVAFGVDGGPLGLMAQLHRLNARQVHAVKNPLKPGLHGDGGNLYLKVDKDRKDGAPGAKRWTFIYQFAERRREMGLGALQDVSLERARDLAKVAREQVAAGVDPKAAREAEEAAREIAALDVAASSGPTFKDVAMAVLEAKKKTWRGEKTEARWLNAINNHCAAIAALPVAELNTPDIVGVLNPIWHTIPEGAQKTQEIIRIVMDSATAQGLRDGLNPARWDGHLQAIFFERRRLTRGSHAALNYAGVADFLARLRNVEGPDARSLEFLILTGARSGEVREAKWCEIDIEGGLWSIPRARVKEQKAMERAQVTHKRTPLNAPAVHVLARMKKEAPEGPFVFVGEGGATLGVNAMRGVVQGLTGKGQATPHGFRSTFRDWAGDQRVTMTDGRKFPAYSWEACEIALGHSVGDNTTKAYRRGDLLEERRDLLRDWGVVCDGGTPTYADPAADQLALVMAFLVSDPVVRARFEVFAAAR